MAASGADRRRDVNRHALAFPEQERLSLQTRALLQLRVEHRGGLERSHHRRRIPARRKPARLELPVGLDWDEPDVAHRRRPPGGIASATSNTPASAMFKRSDVTVPFTTVTLSVSTMRTSTEPPCVVGSKG